MPGTIELRDDDSEWTADDAALRAYWQDYLRRDIVRRSDHGRIVGILFPVLAVLWVIGSPIFYFMDTAFDGLVERGLAGVLLLWVAVCAWSLIRERELDRDGGRGEV